MSIGSFRANVCVLTLFLVAAPLAGCRAPSFGEKVSTHQEVLIGTEAAAELEAQDPPVKDPAVTGRVQAVAGKIFEQAKVARSGITYTVKVLPDSDIDAFCLPGGWIYLDQGLIQKIGDDDDMLAAVIAHEAAHEALRHPADQLADALGKEQLIDLLTEGKYQDVGNITLQLDQFSHSREDEYQADQLGVRFAWQAGYDPNGLLRFFALMQSMPEDAGKPEWLVTHPLTRNRILRAEADIKALGRPAH